MEKYKLKYNKEIERNKITMFKRKTLKNNLKVNGKLDLEKEKTQKILDKKLLELHEAWKGYFTDLGKGYVEIRFRHN
jgi:hypothetical protein